MWEKIIVGVGVAVVAIAIVFVVSLLLALPVMWLWNWLMPTLFAVPKVTFLQAWGVSLLAGLLFKGSASKATSSGS